MESALNSGANSRSGSPSSTGIETNTRSASPKVEDLTTIKDALDAALGVVNSKKSTTAKTKAIKQLVVKMIEIAGEDPTRKAQAARALSVIRAAAEEFNRSAPENSKQTVAENAFEQFQPFIEANLVAETAEFAAVEEEVDLEQAEQEQMLQLLARRLQELEDIKGIAYVDEENEENEENNVVQLTERQIEAIQNVLVACNELIRLQADAATVQAAIETCRTAIDGIGCEGLNVGETQYGEDGRISQAQAELNAMAEGLSARPQVDAATELGEEGFLSTTPKKASKSSSSWFTKATKSEWTDTIQRAKAKFDAIKITYGPVVVTVEREELQQQPTMMFSSTISAATEESDQPDSQTPAAPKRTFRDKIIERFYPDREGAFSVTAPSAVSEGRTVSYRMGVERDNTLYHVQVDPTVYERLWAGRPEDLEWHDNPIALKIAQVRIAEEALAVLKGLDNGSPENAAEITNASKIVEAMHKDINTLTIAPIVSELEDYIAHLSRLRKAYADRFRADPQGSKSRFEVIGEAIQEFQTLVEDLKTLQATTEYLVTDAIGSLEEKYENLNEVMKRIDGLAARIDAHAEKIASAFRTKSNSLFATDIDGAKADFTQKGASLAAEFDAAALRSPLYSTSVREHELRQAGDKVLYFKRADSPQDVNSTTVAKFLNECKTFIKEKKYGVVKKAFVSLAAFQDENRVNPNLSSASAADRALSAWISRGAEATEPEEIEAVLREMTLSYTSAMTPRVAKYDTTTTGMESFANLLVDTLIHMQALGMITDAEIKPLSQKFDPQHVMIAIQASRGASSVALQENIKNAMQHEIISSAKSTVDGWQNLHAAYQTICAQGGLQLTQIQRAILQKITDSAELSDTEADMLVTTVIDFNFNRLHSSKESPESVQARAVFSAKLKDIQKLRQKQTTSANPDGSVNMDPQLFDPTQLAKRDLRVNQMLAERVALSWELNFRDGADKKDVKFSEMHDNEIMASLETILIQRYEAMRDLGVAEADIPVFRCTHGSFESLCLEGRAIHVMKDAEGDYKFNGQNRLIELRATDFKPSRAESVTRGLYRVLSAIQEFGRSVQAFLGFKVAELTLLRAMGHLAKIDAATVTKPVARIRAAKDALVADTVRRPAVLFNGPSMISSAERLSPSPLTSTSLYSAVSTVGGGGPGNDGATLQPHFKKSGNPF